MKSFSTRKGISPLIAAVLLIAFTMAVAAILTAFVTTYTRDTTEAVGNTSEQLIECSSAGLEIRSASTNFTHTSVTVENTGRINLTNGVTVSAFDDNQTFLGSKDSTDFLESASIREIMMGGTGGDTVGNASEVSARSRNCPEISDDHSDVEDEESGTLG